MSTDGADVQRELDRLRAEVAQPGGELAARDDALAQCQSDLAAALDLPEFLILQRESACTFASAKLGALPGVPFDRVFGLTPARR